MLKRLIWLAKIVDELDIDKLKTVAVDLSKLSNVVSNDVVKLVTKAYTIDTGELVLKTQYNNRESGVERKIDDASKNIAGASGFVKKKRL